MIVEVRNSILLVVLLIFLCIISKSNCYTIQNHCPVDFDVNDAQESTTSNTQPNNSRYDCPENFLYDQTSQSCQKIYVKGNCGELMIFMPKMDDHGHEPEFGICMCDNFDDLDNNSCTFRPKLYWKPEKRCYYAYEQGPCKSDEWLTYIRSPGLYDRVLCVINPCPSIPSDDSTIVNLENQFWFPFGGNCYLSGSQGFCREAENRAYLSREAFSPLCISENLCLNNTTSAAEEEPCVKGTRNRRYVGRCRKKHRNINIGDTLQ